MNLEKTIFSIASKILGYSQRKKDFKFFPLRVAPVLEVKICFPLKSSPYGKNYIMFYVSRCIFVAYIFLTHVTHMCNACYVRN